MSQKIVVIGAGSWGTAIACQFAKRALLAHLLVRDNCVVDDISANHTNSKYLGDIKLPENVSATLDYSIIRDADVIVLSVPSVAILEVIRQIKEIGITPQTRLLIATKGLSRNPVELISNLLQREFPENKVAFIYGANFAKEVALGKLSGATIGCVDLQVAYELAQLLQTENFVISTTDDIITLQIASSVKNIIAIQSGIYEAKNYGENARALLITQGLQEISKISTVMGGRINTAFEVGVVGDLMLTCYSKTSRNTRFGYELAQQSNPQEFIQSYPALVEGVESARLIWQLISSYSISVPIIESVANNLKLHNNILC